MCTSCNYQQQCRRATTRPKKMRPVVVGRMGRRWDRKWMDWSQEGSGISGISTAGILSPFLAFSGPLGLAPAKSLHRSKYTHWSGSSSLLLKKEANVPGPKTPPAERSACPRSHGLYWRRGVRYDWAGTPRLSSICVLPIFRWLDELPTPWKGCYLFKWMTKWWLSDG